MEKNGGKYGSIFSLLKKSILLLFSTIMLLGNSVPVQGSSFESRRLRFLQANGNGYEDHVAIWAWLENNDQSKADQIHEVVYRWATEEWRWGWDLTCVQLTRVLIQYGDRISQEDHDMLYRMFGWFLPNLWMFHTGSMNNRFFDYTVRFIHSERRDGVNVQYGEQGEPRLPTFTWDGVEYKPGRVYNSEQIARAWFYYIFNELLVHGDEELDSEYTKALIISLYTLYDFAQDQEMKKAAKMMLDFLLIEAIMDVGGCGLHGGNIGRTYSGSVLTGHPQIYHWIYWGVGPNPGSNRQGQFFDAYVSTYRLPELIEDIGILDDEPDNYWHINRENNFAGYCPKNQGSWTYVTKYYNLGGSAYQWMLNVKATGPHEDGIRLWVNDLADGEACSNGECYLALGAFGFQYKNCMYIRSGNTPKLHMANNIGTFETEDVDGSWRFFKEDKVAVAIKLQSGGSYLEVAIMGVDYADFGDFKSACIHNANRLPYESGHTTSRGDKITEVYDPEKRINHALFNGEYVWDFPFKRIETEAYNGTKIVDWDKANHVMTVQWHDVEAVYDFKNWTYSYNQYEDVVSPNPPQGVTVSRKE